MKTFLIILLSLFLIAVSFAQVPQLVNYQGKLDSSGVPITGTRNLTFKIYDAATAGSTLWTESQANVTITNGIFNVLLGSVTPFTAGVFGGTGERHLGVTVGTVAEMVPRYRITSTAFSIRAASADGVADNSVTSAKIVDGTVAAADLASNSVTAAKIADEPGVARGANTGSVAIANSGVTNITSSSITVPGPGYIVALGHAFGQIAGTSIGNILAGIETASTTSPTQYIAFGANDQTFASSVIWWGAVSNERTFNVTAAGSYTYYLNVFRGWTGGSASIWYSKLVLMYFPTSYGTVTKSSDSLNENTDQSPASGSNK